MKRLATQIIHNNFRPPSGFAAAQSGVFSASSVFFKDPASFAKRDWLANDQYVYGYHGTPTTFELESQLARLDGANYCVLYASGLQAISSVFQTFLRPGDEVCIPYGVYGAVHRLIENQLMPLGIRARYFDPMSPSQFRVRKSTKLLWIEAPATYTFAYPDLAAFTKIAHRHDLLVGLDNSWGCGVAFKPHNLGVNICMQSVSKFTAGTGDVMMGAVTTRDLTLHQLLRLHALRTGVCVSGKDAGAVLTGLKTLPIRYLSQDKSARDIIDFIASHSKIANILHPALPSSIGHNHWKANCTAAAGIFTILFNSRVGKTAVNRFLNALQLFKLGFGWGGPVSLALPLGTYSPPNRIRAGQAVRIAIGLEDAEDLKADLWQALEAL